MPFPRPSPSPLDPRPVPIPRPIYRQFKPGDWYWIVGADETQVYSSNRGAFFPVADAEYQAWLELRGDETVAPRPTRIASQAELDEVLDNAGVSQRVRNIRLDARRAQIITQLTTRTNTQILTFFRNNFPSLTQAEQDILAGLALVLAGLLRRE